MPKIFKVYLIVAIQMLMVACGSSSSDKEIEVIPDPDVIPPKNDTNLRAALRDTNGETLKINGTISINIPQDAQAIHQYDLYWIDTNSDELIGEVINSILASELNEQLPIMEIENTIDIPNENAQLVLIAKDINGDKLEQDIIEFLDYTGNAFISGKGGTIAQSWVYGEDRPFLNAHVETINGNSICTFDNGLVMIIDMQNERDMRDDIVVDDELYPAYSFNCTDSFEHNGRNIWNIAGGDEDGFLVAYSPLNDALHYATVTYDMMFKHLGRPPFNDKYRLRIHYADNYNSGIFWDGIYANFGDEPYTSSYGSVGLDIVAHELGHGFLSHNTPLKLGLATYHRDAVTLHEAFSDMSGAAAKYYYLGETHWQHGEETQSPNGRDGSKIITREGGLPSYLDNSPTILDSYSRMGMVTYPFYVLTNKWGMDRSYPLMLDAAQNCWQPYMIFPEIAQCVLDAAINRNESSQDVIDAFKEVKIKLFEEGTMAHFDALQIKRNISFSDTSVSTSETSEWHWDFGDGNTSNEKNPVHDYIEGGRYTPVLTVTDLEGDTDSYTRPIDVFTDYCAPTSINYGRTLQKLILNGHVIDKSDENRYDFTNTIISISKTDGFIINVEGNSTREGEDDWGIWLDLNDDGVFDNTYNSSEYIYSDKFQSGENYGLNIDLAIPELINESPLRMRISGDFSVSNPCSVSKKTTVDILVDIQEP